MPELPGGRIHPDSGAALTFAILGGVIAGYAAPTRGMGVGFALAVAVGGVALVLAPTPAEVAEAWAAENDHSAEGNA